MGTGSNRGISGSNNGFAAVVRKGQWRSSKDAFAEAAMSAVDTSEPRTETNLSQNISRTACAPNPLWLVNKRVKIWWEGNQTYFEGDVTGYIEKTNQHTILYSIDASSEAELLWVKAGDESTSGDSPSNSPVVLDNVSSWMWLDETREDRKIQRRVRTSICKSIFLDYISLFNTCFMSYVYLLGRFQ
jgi:hypothetical protein